MTDLNFSHLNKNWQTQFHCCIIIKKAMPQIHAGAKSRSVHSSSAAWKKSPYPPPHCPKPSKRRPSISKPSLPTLSAEELIRHRQLSKPKRSPSPDPKEPMTCTKVDNNPINFEDFDIISDTVVPSSAPTPLQKSSCIVC